jgi:hypothetical protein
VWRLKSPVDFGRNGWSDCPGIRTRSRIVLFKMTDKENLTLKAILDIRENTLTQR